MHETVAQVIEANGGSTAFAARVGKPAGSVRVWKHRNCFPRDCWPEIMKAFPDMTLDRLMKIEARPVLTEDV